MFSASDGRHGFGHVPVLQDAALAWNYGCTKAFGTCDDIAQDYVQR